MNTPGTVDYPGSLDTAVTLLEATNGAATSLTVALAIGGTVATVISTTTFPTTGALVLNGVEIAFYTGKTGTTFTGLIRGADGTSAAAHSIGDDVEGRIIARHHTVLSEALRAVQARVDSRDETESDFAAQINGVNVDFVTSVAFQAGSTKVYLNGLRQFPVDDFSELNSTTVRFTSAPIVGDRIIVDYIRS